MHALFSKAFQYKNGFMNPFEWRAREFNAAADLACNVILDSRAPVHTIDTPTLVAALRSGSNIQFYSDGGYRCGRGACAFVIVLSTRVDGFWSAELAGLSGIYLEDGVSSFHAEILAAEMATDFAVGLSKELRHPE